MRARASSARACGARELIHQPSPLFLSTGPETTKFSRRKRSVYSRASKKQHASDILNFWWRHSRVWTFENCQLVWRLKNIWSHTVCMAGSHINNSPTPTDLTDNTQWGKSLFVLGWVKIGLRGSMRNLLIVRTTETDFWKMFSSSR
jgi:hypothetical protein